MITSRKNSLLATVLASAAFISGAAIAQTPQAPITAPVPPAAEAQVAPPVQAKGAHKHQRMDPAQRMERMKAHRAERLSSLKQKLQLNAAQEPAWNQFASAQQPPQRAPGDMKARRAEMEKLTTPERLDGMQARQAERAAHFAKRADATRSLYSALSVEQKKTFDAESMRFGPRGPGPHHGPHRG